MKKISAIILLTIVVSFLAYSPAWSDLSRTPWEMHDGLEVTSDNPLGLVEFDCSPSRHGDECEYSVAIIPPEDNSGWGPAPNGDVINFSIDSRVCDAPNTCYVYGDFTYFQTFVDISENTVLTEFTISFSGMDDGSRVTIFNSKYTDGVVVPESYVYLGGSGTSDLKEYVVCGELNRVIITQVDDCCSENNLWEAKVVLNGEAVEVVDPEPVCPVTQSDVDAAYDQGFVDGQATCEEEPECAQVITYGQVPNINCWVMFSTPCDVPDGWEIVYEEPSNMCGSVDDTSSENTDNCSTFNIFSNTLHVPCFNGGSTMYWLDLELTGSEPITLELKDLGTN